MTDEAKTDGVGTPDTQAQKPEPKQNPFIVRGSEPKRKIEVETEPAPIIEETEPQVIKYMADGQQHDFTVPAGMTVDTPEAVKELQDMLSGRKATENRKAARTVDVDLTNAISQGVVEGLSKSQPAKVEPEVNDDPLRLLSTRERTEYDQIMDEADTDEEKRRISYQTGLLIANRQGELANFKKNKTLAENQETLIKAMSVKSEWEDLAVLDPNIPMDHIDNARSYLQNNGFNDWVQKNGAGEMLTQSAYRLFLKDTGKETGDKLLDANSSKPEGKNVSQTAMKKVAEQLGTTEMGSTVGRDADDAEIRQALAVEGPKKATQKYGEKAATLFAKIRGLPPMEKP